MEKTLESYLSADEFMKLIDVHEAEEGEISFYKDKLNKLANNDLDAISKQIDIDLYAPVGFGVGTHTLDEAMANKIAIATAKKASKLSKAKPKFTAETFMKEYPVQDGTFEQLNSMLAGGGFKLFTEDGKVIIPHNLDELATISEGNTGSLIDLFSSAANAYKQAATAVTIMNSGGGINRSKDEYEASGEVIDKMMNLVYDTLDICINRDIKVNKQVTWWYDIWLNTLLTNIYKRKKAQDRN